MMELRTAWLSFLVLLISLLSTTSFVQAQMDGHPACVVGKDANNNAVCLPENRQPALYTSTFGDCLGGSIIDVSRFDAAYYKDNMTITFHLQGSTPVTNLTLMLYISVYAYGSQRFEKIFDPCQSNILSLCPTNVSVPIEAAGLIPVSAEDVSGIPAIALEIPDFEGQAVLRVFSNATSSEIACFSAVVTNGVSLSQPVAVGSIIGVITLLAAVASFATAVYGDHVPTMRSHYAHSLSMFVIFAVYHHVYYLGALSMNWPSVLPSWWSNFAWSAGMIYTPSMQASINSFLGNNFGNASVVGAANLGSSDNTGGGYTISKIYKRGMNDLFKRVPYAFDRFYEAYTIREERRMEGQIVKRSLENVTTGFDWYGAPVTPGLPLPGNFTGFAGTTSSENIPASNAFLTGLCWLLITIVIAAGCIAIFKGALELFSRKRWMPRDRFALFRKNWIGVIAMTSARILFIAFFMMMFLTLFQFVYRGAVGAIVLAVIAFLVFFVGFAGIAYLSCYYRTRDGTFTTVPDRLHVERRWVLKVIPWMGTTRESVRKELGPAAVRPSLFSVPWKTVNYSSPDPTRVDAVEDKAFLMRYGWLTARYRRSRWWFAAVWLAYEFVRACFYGGAAGHPATQVFGLLAVEIVGFILIINLKPFEGTRLNAIMVYLLGLSKVLTVALSSAFHPQFGLDRIFATAIGIIIIVIQGLLLAVLVAFIFIGAITSYMSLTRNRDEFHPELLANRRRRYFAHIEEAALDHRKRRGEPTNRRNRSQLRLNTMTTDGAGNDSTAPGTAAGDSPGFKMLALRRVPKIEDAGDGALDEDGIQAEGVEPPPDAFDPWSSRTSIVGPGGTRRTSRAVSVHSNRSYSNLPFGARAHRASWASKDFISYHEASQRAAGGGIVSPAGSGGMVQSPTSIESAPPLPGSGITTPVNAAVRGREMRGQRSSSSMREGYGISTPGLSRPQSNHRSRATSRGRRSRPFSAIETGDGRAAERVSEEQRESEEWKEREPRSVS